MNRANYLLVNLIFAAVAFGQTVIELDPREIWPRKRDANRASYFPKDFKRDIPYAVAVEDLSGLAGRLNELTTKLAGSAIFRPLKTSPARNLLGQMEWTTDDSQEEAVSKSQLLITVRAKSTLAQAEDEFINWTLVPAVFKPCVVSGPKVGDLCLQYEEANRLTLLVLRNNVVFVVRSIGSFVVPREPGSKIPPGTSLRRDGDVKPRGWELIRAIDDLILDLSSRR